MHLLLQTQNLWFQSWWVRACNKIKKNKKNHNRLDSYQLQSQHEHINLWGHRWQWTMIHGRMHTYLKMADTMREIPALNRGSGERLKTNSRNKMWSRSGKHTTTPTRNHCAPLYMKLLFNKSQWSKADKLLLLFILQ